MRRLGALFNLFKIQCLEFLGFAIDKLACCISRESPEHIIRLSNLLQRESVR